MSDETDHMLYETVERILAARLRAHRADGWSCSCDGLGAIWRAP
jgi:hypothetical protein